jgi:chromosome segregation ATPase
MGRENKQKMNTINRQRSQLESLRKTQEKKSKQIDALLQDKQKLLDERENYIDELEKLHSVINKEGRQKFISVLESLNSHRSNMESQVVAEQIATPEIKIKSKGTQKRGVAK